MTDNREQTNLRYVDTGRIKIGIYYDRKPQPLETTWDDEFLQHAMLPKPLGRFNGLRIPTLREALRWLVT